jgi:hypothetical protein
MTAQHHSHKKLKTNSAHAIAAARQRRFSWWLDSRERPKATTPEAGGSQRVETYRLDVEGRRAS